MVEVLVPATSANLGPGFDTMGLALGQHDQLMAVITDDPGVRVDIEGEGAGQLPTDDTHLVVQAIAAAGPFTQVPQHYSAGARFGLIGRSDHCGLTHRPWTH